MQPDYYGDEPPKGGSPDPYGGYGAKPIQESRLPLYLTFIVLGVVCFFAFRYIISNRPAGSANVAQPPVQAALPSNALAPDPSGSVPSGATAQEQAPAYRAPQVETTVQQSASGPRQGDLTHRPGDKSPGWKAREIIESSQADD